MIEFLPSIYIYYQTESDSNDIRNNNNNILTNPAIKVKIKLDNSYWMNNNNFIGDIRREYIKSEIRALYKYMSGIINTIDRNYKNNVDTLIYSDNIDMLSGLLIVFTFTRCGFTYDEKMIKILQSKLNFRLSISRQMMLLIKYFILYYNK